MSDDKIRAMVNEHDIKICKGNWTITEQNLTDADEIWIVASCIPGHLQIKIMNRYGPTYEAGLMCREAIDCLDSIIVNDEKRTWLCPDDVFASYRTVKVTHDMAQYVIDSEKLQQWTEA